MRQDIIRRRDRSQHAVHAHPHLESVAKRLDVNVACAQFDCFLYQVIDRAHDRRAACEVPQILRAFVGAPAHVIPAYRNFAIKLFAESGRDILERGDEYLEGRAKDDFSGLQRRVVGRIAGRKREPSIASLKGKDGRLTQEARRKPIRQRTSF